MEPTHDGARTPPKSQISLFSDEMELSTGNFPSAPTVAVDPMPGRMTNLLSNIMSTIASILLLAEFLAIQAEASSIVNPLGAASCVGWVVTFVLVIYWNVFDAFPVYGPDKIGLIGPLTRLVAACFFNIQPWSALIAPIQAPEEAEAQCAWMAGYGVPGIGVPWSNFVGIVLFHIGNCVDAVNIYKLFAPQNGYGVQSGNWVPLALWTFCTATWFLVIAGGIAFFSGPTAGTLNSQIFGSFLLLVGSLLFVGHSAENGKPKGQQLFQMF